MKKSRHLLLLVLLLTLVTGGVYASWTYATKEANSQNVGGNTIDIETAQTTNRGTIKLGSSTKAFTLKFDDVNYNHKVDLNPSEVILGGSPVSVTYTVADGSNIDLSILNYTVKLTLVSNFQWEGNPILTTKSIDLKLTKSGAEGKDYTGSITTAEIFKAINGVNIDLATAEEHANFVKALNSQTFTVVISDDAAVAQAK